MTTQRKEAPHAGDRAQLFAAIQSGIPLSKNEMHRSLGPSPISWEIVVPASRREKALEGALMGCAVAEAIGIALSSSNRVDARRQIHDQLRRVSVPMWVMPGDRTHAMILSIQAILLSRASIDDFGSKLRKRLAWYRSARWAGCVCEGLRRFLLGGRRSKLSAGLGQDPMVRAAILSVVFQGHGKGGLRWVQRSTIATHPDALVTNAAMLIAVSGQCAQLASTSFEIPSADFMPMLSRATTQPILKERLDMLGKMLRDGRSLKRAARSLGYDQAVDGNLVDNALLAIYAWRRYGHDFRTCTERILGLGGQVAGIAAIAGTLMGTQHSMAAIPEEWMERTLMDPHDTVWRERFVERLRDWPHGPEDIQRTLALPIMPIGQWKRNLRFACWKLLLPLLKRVRRLHSHRT